MDFEGLIQETKPQRNPYRVPGFSFGYREEADRLPPVPGPGTYETNRKSSKNEGIAFSQSPRFDAKTLVNAVPGPGAYYSDCLIPVVSPETRNSSQKSQKVQGTFSKAQRMGLFNTTSPAMGPGQYGVKRDFEVLPKERKVSKTKQDKGSDADKSTNFYQVNDNPGPGQYDVLNSINLTKTQNSGYSLPKSNRSFTNVKQLAEQGMLGDIYRYNKHDAIGKEGPKFTFGTGKRTELSPQTHSPGPFSYFHEFKDPRDKYMMKGTFSQAPRVVGEMKKVELGPSPAEYEYDIGSFKKGLKMNKSPKESNDEPFSPGPGAYDILDEFNAKKREVEKKLKLQQTVMMSRSPKNMTEVEEGKSFADKTVLMNLTEPTSPTSSKIGSPKRGPIKAMWVEDIIKKSVSPGPAYMVQTENIELAHTGVRFATESRPDFVIEEIKKDVPGPGRYDSKVVDSQSTQPVKFPNSKRKDNPVLQEYTLEIPGPEKYDAVKIASRSIFGGSFGRTLRGLGFDQSSARDHSKQKKKALNNTEEIEVKNKEK